MVIIFPYHCIYQLHVRIFLTYPRSYNRKMDNKIKVREGVGHREVAREGMKEFNI